MPSARPDARSACSRAAANRVERRGGVGEALIEARREEALESSRSAACIS
jgi:hypothetical protein